MPSAATPNARKTIHFWRRGLAIAGGTIAVVCFTMFLLTGCWIPSYFGQGAVMGRIVTPMTFLSVHHSDPRWVYVRGHYFGDLKLLYAPYYASIPESNSIVVVTESESGNTLHVIDEAGTHVRSVSAQHSFGSHLGTKGPLAFHDDVLGLSGDELRVQSAFGGLLTVNLQTGEWVPAK